MALLRFEHGPAARIWGGTRLQERLGLRPAGETPLGEDWLISDHLQHESVVREGPHAGRTLRELLREAPNYLLGSLPRLTPSGRFPLLLKLLDAAEPLSVQVHPDDAAAERLHEPDIGKTEMWHVLEAAPGAELTCGLLPQVTPELLRDALARGKPEEVQVSFPAQRGTTVFVPAGTVHAIGAGVFLAEIQQNSDLTYRLYDYGRCDAQGNPRALHLEKGLQVTHFDSMRAGPNNPLDYPMDGAGCSVLGACRYFAARKITFNGGCELPNDGRSFHLLLMLEGGGEVQAGGCSASMEPFEAVLVAGCAETITLTGAGTVLDYFVPELAHDILRPLRAAGHPDAEIVRLGGAMEDNELVKVL